MRSTIGLYRKIVESPWGATADAYLEPLYETTVCTAWYTSLLGDQNRDSNYVKE